MYINRGFIPSHRKGCINFSFITGLSRTSTIPKIKQRAPPVRADVKKAKGIVHIFLFTGSQIKKKAPINTSVAVSRSHIFINEALLPFFWVFMRINRLKQSPAKVFVTADKVVKIPSGSYGQYMYFRPNIFWSIYAPKLHSGDRLSLPHGMPSKLGTSNPWLNPT